MADQWRPTYLSTTLPYLTKSKEDLKLCLQQRSIDVGECHRILEEMDRYISVIMQAFSSSWPPQNDQNSASLIQKLSDNARHTLWDEIPVRAIAKAHNERAKTLAYRGNIDGDPSQLYEVYIEYAKSLLLQPRSNDPLYIDTYRNLAALEASLRA
ncbi:hypothetical protein DFH07DRAFT_777332 [Mycena maculata]|uniref:Uncharacterized protein n=1 Tax=Mycena maculata TaxID=230809 RepID=A0AAD7II63_9AGAR|nr:hypothetical protein DFH07DRAFT_777332 [Mycena maculata]